VPLSPKVSK